MQKDIDYTIDYFSGTINFINQAALDPTAEISVSYEENEFISFDQKLLIFFNFFKEFDPLCGQQVFFLCITGFTTRHEV